MANNGRFEYTIGFKTDNSGLNQARKALQELQNITVKTPGFENMADDLQLAKKYASELEGALSRSFNVKLKTTDVTKLRNELGQMDLKEIYRGLSAIGPKGEEVFNRMATQAMKTNLQVKQGNTLLKKFGDTLYRNLEWMLAGNLVRTVTGVFQKAYGFTKNLDSSLNDIRIVTGKSADEMARFGAEAQKTAAALGKGTTDITNASLIFYQQGLDTAEVNARTEVSTKLANVTKQSTDITADQLTAVWNGYKATNDELERYADIMTAVAANTASSSAELSSAISKVASVANTTGVDMEQLTAMMSTVISVTRESPETVGTAFKTIFARINDLVEDGTDEFGVSLGRISSHLKAMGIEILDENGNLKDLGDTLSKVGNDWNQYSREQQVAIAEQIGGKRQWNQVVALFDNWNKYAEALDVAKNSTGELQRQQDIYMESTAAHLQAIKTAWEGVYGQLMSSDDINKVADFFTATLKTVETFLESIGGIGPVLQMVAGYMLQAFGPQIGQQMAKTINNFRIMKDNASQIAAQRDLTRIIGSVEDNALMQKLVGQHQQILKYKNLMTDADRQEYEAYLDQTVALKAKEDQLKKEIKDTEDLLAQRKALSEEYQKSGKDLSGGGFSSETLERAQDTAKNYLQNQTVDTYAGVIQLGTAKYSVADNLVDDRINQISSITSKIDQEIQKGQLSEEAIRKYEALSNALKRVSKDFENAKNSGEMSLGSFKKHEEQVEKSANKLKSFETELSKLGIDLQSLTRQGKETSQFWDENSDVLMRSEKTIKNYTTAIEEMATNGTLTTEQVEELNKKLQALNKLDVSDPGHLKDYENIIQSINADLKNFATQAQGDLTKIGEAIENNTSTKLKNTQAGLEAWGDSFNQQLNKLNIEAFFNKLTQLANLTSQLSMTFTQISNIKSIINDENLKESEKMSKIISSLVFMAPMVINLIKSITQGLIGSALAKQKDNIESAKNNLLIVQKDRLEKNDIATKKRKIAVEAKENAILKDKNATLAYQKWLEADQAFKKAQANGALSQRIVKEEAAARAALEKAIAEHKNAEATAAAAATDSSAANEALKRASANEAAAKSALTANQSFKGFFSSISWGTVAIGAFIAFIAYMVYKFKELKEAQEEATEASNRVIEAAQKLQESNKELRKSVDEQVNAFKSFEDVWENFRKGKVAIDEVKSSVDALTGSLDLSEDLEYQNLLRIAKYTNDYTKVSEYVQEQLRNRVAAANATYQQDADVSMTTATNIFAGKNITSRTSTGFWSNLLKGQGLKSFKYFGEAGEAGFAGTRYTQNKAVLEYLKELGAVTEIKESAFGNYSWKYNTDMTKEQLRDLINSESVLKTYQNSDIAAMVLEAIGPITSNLDASKENFYKKLSHDASLKFTELQGDTDLEKAVDFRKQFQKLFEEQVRAWEEEYGTVMTPELKEKLRLQMIQDFSELYPDEAGLASEYLTKNEKVYQTFRTAIKGYWEKIKLKNWKKLSRDELDVLQNQLQASGLDLEQINWDAVVQNEETMTALIEHRGHWMQEDIDLLRNYVIENKSSTETLLQDYDSLIDSWNTVDEKLQKGTLSRRNLLSNKDYKNLITDELLNEIETVYGADSEYAKALRAVQEGDIFGPKGQEYWKKAGEAIKNAAIDETLENYNTALKKFDVLGDSIRSNGVELDVEVRAQEFYNEMEEITNADYSLDIEIRTRMEEATDEIQASMAKLTEIGSSIGEGFTIASDKLEDFAKFFNLSSQDMLSKATVLEDGTIQLSQEATQQAIKEKRKEIDAEIQSQITKLEIQNKILKHKQSVYKNMLEIAQQMANGEFTTEAELKDAKETLFDDIQSIQLDNDAATAVAEDKIKEVQLEQLKNYYSDALNLEIKYQKSRMQAILNPDDGETIKNAFDNIDLYQKFNDEELTDEERLKKYGTTVILPHQEDYLGADARSEQMKLGAALQAIYSSRVADIQKNIDFNLEEIDILKLEQSSWHKQLDSIGQSTSATKDNTSATKENAEAQAQLIEILNEEIDAYHDINIEIKQLETQLSRLQKQQSKLTGDALLKNLQEQLDILEKQNDAYLRKYDIMSIETAATRASLADQGVEFNSDGTISNYAAMIQQKQQYVQDLQSQYNNMSKEEQDGFKDTVEQAKKDYENFKKAITDYDSLITEKIPELQDKIQDIADKEIEIQISKAKMKVQAILDDQDLKRTEIEFKKKLARLKDDDILGNLTVNLEVMATYTADNGSLIALQQEVDRLTQVRADMDAGIFFSSEYGDNRAKLEEDLKAYSDQLRQQKEAVIGLRDAIQDAYVSALDQVNEKLDEQKEKYQQISDMLEKQINLYQIRFGDNTFDAINGLMKHQTDLAQKQYNVSLKQLDIFKKEYEKLLEQDPNEELEITQQAKKHFEEANAKVYEDLVSLFEARQKQYENAVKAFFEIFNRQLTGGKDLDYVRDSWDRLNADADDYYDAVNGAYEINKLRNQIEKDINKSTDPNVQKQLTNFLNQQVVALEKKDKLSKYDLERANAMYDLEVKRAAFQEAQQNKSKMRLRRDSQGNYSYQFVSDEQQVADTMQELAEAQNKLYNVDTDALKNNNDKILKIIEDYQTAMIDSTNKTDEERAEISKYYQQQLTNAIAEHEDIRSNLLESGLDAYAQKMGMTTEEVKRLSKEQKDAILSDIVPAWNSAVETMIQNMSGEDGIAAMFADTYTQLSNIRQDYFDDLDDYADAAGVDLENIQTAADATIDMMSSLMDSTDEVVDSLEEMLDKVLNVINALTGTPQDMKSALEDLMKTLKPLTDLFPQYINTAQQAVDAAQQTQQVVSNGGNSNTNNGNDNNNGGNNNTNTANNNPTADFNSTSAERDDWGEGNFPKIGDKVIYLGEDYYYDSWGNGPSGNRGAGENKVVEVENVSPNSPYPIAVKSNDSAYGWLKKHQIAKMAKGGYTGDWANTNGKLGILHEKELILNANRTQNLFKAFDSLTNPTKVVQNLMSGLEIMLRKQQFSFLDGKLKQAEDNGAIERNTIINANFPGVHAAVEIEKALNDLINLSTQQVHSTLR